MKRKDYSIVGKPFAREDALDKVLGKPVFTADMIPPDAIFAAVVRSARPHAKILRLNLQAALSTPGVIRFIDGGQVPGINNIGTLVRDKALFCQDIVRSIGDPIGAILAESRDAAEEGARQVGVEYEDLPAIFSPLDALDPKSVQIHPNGNICRHLKIRKGDVERGFRESDVIVENEYTTQMQEHAQLEPETAFALPPDQNGIITTVGPWQDTFDVQDAVALVLGKKSNEIRALQAQTGGAFGSRCNEIANELGALVCLSACITGKPTAIIMSREESVISHSKRHPFHMKYKTGVKRDGTLVAEEIQLICDTGSYASAGPAVVMRAIVHCTGPYVVPNVKADSYCVYTNNPYAGSFRGFGCPQVHFAAESQMNYLAEALSMDPIVLRRKNLLRPGSQTNTGHVLGKSVGLDECLSKVVDALSSIDIPPPEKGRVRGVGVAIGYHGNSLGPEGGDRCGALISIDAAGRVEYMTGLAEYGTGARFAHGQIIAETLGISMNRIHALLPDSLRAPYSGPTVASRSTMMGGNAVLLASQKLRNVLSQEAAIIFDCKPEEVKFSNDTIYCENRVQSIKFEELASISHKKGICLSDSSMYEAPKGEWNEETGLGVAYVDYTFGAIGTVVDVNLQTGYPQVVRVVGAFDCGKVINPLGVIGQVEGAIVQGLGYSVMEEVCTKNGLILNPNLADYFLYTSAETPQIDTILVEGYPSSSGPFGAKAMGEPPIDIVAPAVAQAIYNATGVRVKDLPAVPEKILLSKTKSGLKHII